MLHTQRDVWVRCKRDGYSHNELVAQHTNTRQRGWKQHKPRQTTPKSNENTDTLISMAPQTLCGCSLRVQSHQEVRGEVGEGTGMDHKGGQHHSQREVGWLCCTWATGKAQNKLNTHINTFKHKYITYFTATGQPSSPLLEATAPRPHPETQTNRKHDMANTDRNTHKHTTPLPTTHKTHHCGYLHHICGA